ncbi:hypothetical protein BDB01DRAFT_851637 [Pilobolus umbonatus]|nr:hypothetical protein BDB01DRAFT_851637 [Pilobolus umbonatus]
MVDQAGRVRSSSQKEYYHLCGFDDATHIRKVHQAKYADTHKIMTELDSLKTGDMPKFLTACRKRVQHYNAMNNFYNRGLYEITKMFTHGSNKYNTGASTNVKKSAKNSSSYSRPLSVFD